MKFTARLTNLGIELSIYDGDDPKPLKPASDANQDKPRKAYVYAHMDSTGKIFYIGKGTGRRAWSKERDSNWRRYVEKHLGGNYQVRILKDNLLPSDAEELESEWIAQCSENLVNWENVGRGTDFQALECYHNLRDANRALIKQAKSIEKHDLPQAVKMYIQAIESIPGYALINYEKGLVGQLLAEEADELGIRGEIEALNRLSMCLIKLKRAAEAEQHANSYFALYRRDLQLAASQRITKRIEKALARIGVVKDQK